MIPYVREPLSHRERGEVCQGAACECVLNLRVEAFHKSVPHRSRAGVWLDVYRPRFRGERMYVKLTAHEREGWLLLLSFCIDGRAH